MYTYYVYMYYIIYRSLTYERAYRKPIHAVGEQTYTERALAAGFES